jgi:hypothetical protein
MADAMDNVEQKEPAVQAASSREGWLNEPPARAGESRLTRRQFIWVAAGAAASLLGLGIAFRPSTFATFLGVDYERFLFYQDRYFDRLRELLAFHGVVDACAPLGMSNVAAAVRQFQQANGLAVDGIPGESTLWALQVAWAEARHHQLLQVPADVWPGRCGNDHFWVRQDITGQYNALRNEVRALGGVLTAAAALRELDAPLTPGRIPTSLHYMGVALDLEPTTAMQNADQDPYVISATGDGQWQIWARGHGGIPRTVTAVLWQAGHTQQVQVTDKLIDFSALARRHGFRTIGPHSCFPKTYDCAEWWHLQSETALVPFISQFGAEILSLARYRLADLQKVGPLWANRQRIFQRTTNGWQ